MAGVHSLIVDNAQARRRLDVLIAEVIEGLSRSQAKRLIDDGFVLVDGEESKPAAKVCAGDEIEVTVPPPEVTDLIAEPIPLDVLYEDDWLIAVNKPSGLVVHPAAGHWTGTLVNALLHHCRRLSEGGEMLRPGIVHRLDKDTSGVLVAAKDTTVHWKLAEQFAARQIEKEYRALVGGVVRLDRQVVTARIERHPRDRKRMHATDKGGRAAETVLEVLERFPQTTLLRALPKTGRTHQIRVHCAHIGHPVLGDAVYGRRRTERALNLAVPRHTLHAYQLVFTHPATGQRLELIAPLPDDFRRVLSVLQASTPLP